MVFRLFIILIAAIMIAEWAIMLILDTMLAFLPNIVQMFLDGILLAAALLPVLYLVVCRPMRMEITERKRVDEEIIFKNALLEAQSESTIDGILAVDDKGKMILSNKRFKEMWNIPQDLLESKDGDKMLQYVLFQLKNPEDFLKKVMYLYPRKEEKSRDEIEFKDDRIFDRYSSPLIGSNGNYYGRVWYFRDITERKQAEKEKEMLHTQFLQSQKMAAIGQLAGGVAHEINNPLGVILGFSQSIVKRINEDDPLYVPLKSIEREAIRCKKLVVDLLTFSRAGKTAAEITDINTTIDETLSLIEEQAKERNVEIVKEYARNLPQIPVNKNQFQQVIISLCDNAEDAMPDGGKITITTKQDNNQIEIDIADTGQGMTEEVKKHIFEPFFTTKEFGGGTGLGLSLCYEIIQKHNGTIEVESETGKGTAFAIKLPFAAGKNE